MKRHNISFSALGYNMNTSTDGVKDTSSDEEMLQGSSDNFAAAEAGIATDQPSIGTDVISETEATNVSSETSNSSQGSIHFICLFICYICIWHFCSRYI